MSTLVSRYRPSRLSGRVALLAAIAATALVAVALAGVLLATPAPQPSGVLDHTTATASAGACHVPTAVAGVEGLAPADACTVPVTPSVPDLVRR